MMLKVTVKNNIVPDERLERGMIRMSIDGETVVMITTPDFTPENVEFVFLKVKSIRGVNASTGRGVNASTGSIGIYSNNEIIRAFPIVVENAELIIGGN